MYQNAKFRWSSIPNDAGMKNRTELKFGEVICLSIIYHIPDSWWNSYDFYFDASHQLSWTHLWTVRCHSLVRCSTIPTLHHSTISSFCCPTVLRFHLIALIYRSTVPHFHPSTFPLFAILFWEPVVGQRYYARGKIQHGGRSCRKSTISSISGSWICGKPCSPDLTNTRNRDPCYYCCRIGLSCI